MISRVIILAAFCATAAATVIASSACTSEPRAFARRVAARADLVGGPSALGEVGDYALFNDKIRVIVQGEGFSRGFGVYGGALIDADLVRPHAEGDSSGGRGLDRFSEMFPAMFLRSMAPSPGGILTEDLPDGSATITVTGTAADFIFMIEQINDLFADTRDLRFTNQYKLSPGKRYVEITTTVTNATAGSDERTLRFPLPGIEQFLGGIDLAVPFGEVLLFGAGNKVFAEGAGFDIRFTLERLYKDPVQLPKLPGLVTPFLASKGHGISYGFASGVTDPERSFLSRAGYAGARPDDLLVPFIFSAFSGAFYGVAPEEIRSRESVSFKKYFIVGSGDVASIRDVVHEIREYKTGQFAGFVRDEQTLAAEADVSVVTYKQDGRAYNQHTSDENGSFRGTYEPGTYTFRVVSEGRFTTPHQSFEIKEGETTFLEIDLPAPGLVNIRTVGEDGRKIPAKCSFVGTYGPGAQGFDPKRFLFDLEVGEEFLSTDFIPDTADPKTREFLEKAVIVAQGELSERVRPGKYRVVCSRGIEYDVFEQEVEVRSGAITKIDAYLARAVDSKGWVSGDYHLHSINSVDSALPLDERVAQVAAEGVEIACSSDHNFVTDLGQTIAGLDLGRFVQGMVGLELTTLELGHFNGFPLEYDPGPITKGAFEWSQHPPRELFQRLRALGKYGPENTVIQVNHPRDTILGYFNAFNFNSDRGVPEPVDGILAPRPNRTEFATAEFDLGFDALEIFNGKRFELLRHYRVPEILPPPPLPDNIPPAGEILRDENGKIAFPGGMDDWFTMLNQGLRFTATGNSDSHGYEEEPGYPRTYTPVSDEAPGSINELEIIAAMKTQRAFVTNGPLLFFTLGGKGLGEVADGTSGEVVAEVRVETAPWVSLDTLNFISNGEVIHTLRGSKEELSQVTLTLPIDRDRWILVEAIGQKSLWPVVTPIEIPPLQISDVVGSLAATFNFGGGEFGNLRPSVTTVVYAYGFTNPIYVDSDGNGLFDPPGASRRALTLEPVEPPETPAGVNAKRVDVQNLPILLKMFGAFAHGHE